MVKSLRSACRAGLLASAIALVASACASSASFDALAVPTPVPVGHDGAAPNAAVVQTISPDGVSVASIPAPAVAPPSMTDPATTVWLADLTWQEVQSRIASGSTTIIVPTGGTEQNGPHLALDKHNVVIAHTAEQIARQVGATLVAPVLGYVPEGDLAARDGHLNWAGTISVPPAIYSQVLEATAESLIGHGFDLVVFVGDSGSSQSTQQAVADALSARHAGSGTRVANLNSYYQPAGQREIMYAAGISDAQIGSHAGAIDTSEVLAIRPDLVRSDRAAAGATPGTLDAVGVDGDARVATAILGRQLLDLKIRAGAEQLRSLTQ